MNRFNLSVFLLRLSYILNWLYNLYSGAVKYHLFGLIFSCILLIHANNFLSPLRVLLLLVTKALSIFIISCVFCTYFSCVYICISDICLSSSSSHKNIY